MPSNKDMAITYFINYFVTFLGDEFHGDPAHIEELRTYIDNAPQSLKLMLVAAAEEHGLCDQTPEEIEENVRVELVTSLASLGDLCLMCKANSLPYLKYANGQNSYAELAMECSERFVALVKSGQNFTQAMNTLDLKGFIERHNSIYAQS